MKILCETNDVTRFSCLSCDERIGKDGANGHVTEHPDHIVIGSYMLTAIYRVEK